MLTETDPIEAALYQAVHDYRDPDTGARGVSPLARRMGANAGTLQNKVNPNVDSHRVTLSEFVQICLIAGDWRPLNQLNAVCGHACFKLPPANPSAPSLINDVLTLTREHGDIANAINAALADNQVDAREYQNIVTEIDDLQRAAATLKHALRDLVIDPQHLPKTTPQP